MRVQSAIMERNDNRENPITSVLQDIRRSGKYIFLETSNSRKFPADHQAGCYLLVAAGGEERSV